MMTTAGRHAKKMPPKARAVMNRGRKLVIDVENRRYEASNLTIDQARAMATDINARMAALQQRWEASGDLQALLGGLIFSEQQLPTWVFKALMENIRQQLNNPDATRFLAVRYAHDQLGKPLDEAYEWASRNVTDPTAIGGRDTMMKSYQKIRPQVADFNRIRQRPPRPRRR
jgi:hypothetical protein